VRLSIRWKLAAAFFLITATVLMVSNLFILRTLELSYLGAREATHLANANIIALAGREDIVHGDRNAFYLARNFGAQIQARVLILNNNGRVIIDSFDEPWLVGQVLRHPEVVSALAGTSGSGLNKVSDAETVLNVAVPVLKDKQVIGAVMVVVDVADVYLTLGGIRAQMIGVSILSGLLAALFSLTLAGILTRPLNALTRAVRRMESGDLNQRVPATARDELGDLGQAFNSMAVQLESVDRARRDFVANASHELRSPLASVKALAQSLSDGDERNPEVYREYLRDIDSEMDRLNRMVDNLLHLARLEEQSAPLNMENCDVAELVDHVTGLMSTLAATKGITLGKSASGRPNQSLDRDLIIRVLFNLVDNAIRHTPPGGRVTVEAEAGKTALLFRVRDTGEGIPEEDLPHIFDRFYRADKARSRATGGTGLGLSIVRQAVTRHGGTIEVRSKQGRGTTFEIRLAVKN
jgi:heavy metal sensor kinase